MSQREITRGDLPHLDPGEPIALALDQANKTTVMRVFTGDDAAEAVNAYAMERAAKVDRPVFVFAGADAIAMPPEKVGRLVPPSALRGDRDTIGEEIGIVGDGSEYE